MNLNIEFTKKFKENWELIRVKMDNGGHYWMVRELYFSDCPIMYDAEGYQGNYGKVAYDFPERIPKFVKKGTMKEMHKFYNVPKELTEFRLKEAGYIK